MEPKRKEESNYNIWQPLLLSLVLAGGMFIGYQLQGGSNNMSGISKTGNEANQEKGSVDELMRFIDAKYVDEVDQTEMVEDAIRGIVDKLDPHSNYIPKKYLRDVNDSMDGNFEGIGVEYLVFEDTIVILEVMDDGPSYKAGLLAGDKVISVNDSTIAGVEMSNVDIVNFLKGPKGSEVNVDILRGQEEISFSIKRDKIEIPSVDIGYMLNDNTGYIKINRFSSTTFREYMEQFERMVKEDKLEHVVIDLRQNPGGLLREATKILSQIFQEKDKMLVYTEGRTSKKIEYKTTGKNFFSVDKVAILIDEGSASGSEILAGAIQDWDRGIIIGRRTYGKGLVQEQYPLKGGSALRLTVARYYLPSGRSIQRDYSDLNEYDADLENRLLKGELLHQDSFQLLDTNVYLTDRERVVYGGGGIMPDEFIPINELYLEDDFFKVRNAIPSFVYDHLNEFEQDFEKRDLGLFLKEFEISDSLVDKLMKEVGDEISFDSNEYKFEIKKLIKARVAKHCYGDEGQFKMLNYDDPMIDSALRAFEDKDPLTQYLK